MNSAPFMSSHCVGLKGGQLAQRVRAVPPPRAARFKVRSPLTSLSSRRPADRVLLPTVEQKLSYARWLANKDQRIGATVAKPWGAQ
jgi:hypothetical protein